MTNLGRICQGGPEGENYPKTTRTGKATKISDKKEVWKSLVRASSSAQPTEEKKEENPFSLKSQLVSKLTKQIVPYM